MTKTTPSDGSVLKVPLRQIRRVSRKLGLGRTLLNANQLRQLGIRKKLELEHGRNRYLKLIKRAEPIKAGDGSIEVHMLLEHKRVLEGIWSFYSFAHLVSEPCRFVIHDDGTLTGADVALLGSMFPGCEVVPRAVADATVMEYFDVHGLQLCKKLRQTLIFGLKLFDISFFARNPYFILLDSDTLFFSRPLDLIENGSHAPLARYSVDNGYRYCLSNAELTVLLGRDCIQRFNPGVMRVARDSPSARRIESYLSHGDFWDLGGNASYYAELTLWAMELTHQEALPLPDTYAICPGDLEQPQLVYGHYCGGVGARHLYYSRALPRLTSILGL